ncbi:ABC transporter ATP-binding protein [Gorillibacterium timonense]|uniref:ABC transporter ATP-binding protein n=1 Tax=Gorillibacterium timonense TaxID=1689269 RepID=UPI000A5FA645|nr:ABC transporter ATP-binding protein [Gorillibacterium timonense]
MTLKLVIEQLEKSFGDKRVLDRVDYTFEQGRIYGLLGRNGAGKTTLFNCLSGEQQAEAGGARIIGLPDEQVRPEGASGEEPYSRSSPLSPEDVGYVFSQPILPEFLTGYEFVKFYREIHPQAQGSGQSPDDYLDLVRLTREDRHRLIKDYSHGMKNKIQILCFLIAKPPVILLDEPLTSFDVVVAHEIKQLLLEMKRDHIILFSTHILQLAAELCDEVVLLHKGKLEPISADRLTSSSFEAELVELLKEENHA